MKMMKDVTQEYERMKAELLLIRVKLGLNPCHSVLTAVSTLHDEGKDAFEALRGERCDWASQWQPAP